MNLASDHQANVALGVVGGNLVIVVKVDPAVQVWGGLDIVVQGHLVKYKWY